MPATDPHGAVNVSEALDAVLELVDEAWYGEPIAGTWPAFWSGREYHDGDLASDRVRIYAGSDEIVLLQLTSSGVEVARATFTYAFPPAVIAAALEALIVGLLGEDA